MSQATARNEQVETNGWLSRERALALLLVFATVVICYLHYRLILPFFPALAWALALAVIAHPLHTYILGMFPHHRNLAAGLSVLVVAMAIVAPVIFITHQIVTEAGKYTQTVQEELASGKLRSIGERYPRLTPAVTWLETQLGVRNGPAPRSDQASPNPEAPQRSAAGNESDPIQSAEVVSAAAPVDGAAGMITQGVGSILTGTIWLMMQLFITLMSLFYFFRDRHHALRVVRSMLPLSDEETSEVFQRVDDSIHATIYGSVVVGLVQGAMGGLIFWLLGLPSPLIWGSVMGMLAIIPVLGTFVIWAPTAAYLAFHGDWTRALILATWGGLAIGLIDNLLNPFLVGQRLRSHTLLVFFAILGGIAFFGASGVILGPLILALGDALLEVWRRRTACGGTIEEGVECS